MTDDATDMSTPVTRGELREELAKLENKLDHKLEMWGGALAARITDSNREVKVLVSESERRMTAELARCVWESERRMTAELAHQARAIQEAMQTLVGVIDDKYKDLPRRVEDLETGVSGQARR